MNLAELDNPFWSSLQTRHRDLAIMDGEAARYPDAFAPFLGVSSRDADVTESLERLVEPDRTVLLLGVAPDALNGWTLKAFEPLAQMVCTRRLDPVDGPEVIELADEHREDMLALTALVYPHYFRERTMELGRYFGIYLEDRLAAMIGERLGTDGAQEISAVCTHPDFSGQGLARRLVAMLSNDNLERGYTPFLHVGFDNERAKALYERMGYTLRRELSFWSLHR